MELLGDLRLLPVHPGSQMKRVALLSAVCRRRGGSTWLTSPLEPELREQGRGAEDGLSARQLS